jgi:haloalkane dehalogenase
MNPTRKNFAEVHGLRLAYAEAGRGDPIVLLHGNPTSSFVWRDVIPAVTHLGRCLAPDLLGMGDSDKLPASGPGSYTFADHRHYLDAWFDAVGATDHVTLVFHDWGSALGFDWARRHPGAIQAIAYMEAIVQPIGWDDLPDGAADLFRALRSQAGEQMILRDNFFIESLLPSGVLRPLAPEVLDEYRRPFAQPGEDRRPTLTWPRQIPIDGEPATVAEVVAGYGSWMTANTIPKLFINADPGASLTGAPREFCRTWPNQREITVPGIHLLQEDSAREIGHTLADWISDPTSR